MLLETEQWAHAALVIVITLVSALIARGLLMRAIRRVEQSVIADAAKRRVRAGDVLRKAASLSDTRHAQRTHTTASLLRNVVNIVLVGVVAMIILSTLGVPLGPILASAGIGGVALGFGAQSLVKDYLSGIFMVAEDQYGVGDWIEINKEISGKVETVGLRVTRLRAFDGTVWYVRNGEILQLGNSSQGTSTAIIDVPIALTADSRAAITIMTQVMESMAAEEQWRKVLISDPVVLGINRMDAVQSVLRATADTGAGQQWEFQRTAMNRTRTAFAKAGIEAPAVVPQMDNPAG